MPRSLNRGGLRWVCELPGTCWQLNGDSDSWYLFYTDGPSWYLMGHGYEICLSTQLLKVAMDEAGKEISRISQEWLEAAEQ